MASGIVWLPQQIYKTHIPLTSFKSWWRALPCTHYMPDSVAHTNILCFSCASVHTYLQQRLNSITAIESQGNSDVSDAHVISEEDTSHTFLLIWNAFAVFSKIIHTYIHIWHICDNLTHLQTLQEITETFCPLIGNFPQLSPGLMRKMCKKATFTHTQWYTRS